VQLEGLLGRYSLHKQALHQSSAQHRALFQLAHLSTLPFQICGDVFVNHEDFSLTSAHFLEHLILIELDSTHTSLCLRDLALVAHLNFLNPIKSLRLRVCEP